MSTPCLLAVRDADGWTVVRVAYDGDPSWTGRRLLDHYTDPAVVERLTALGDLNVLRDTPEACEPRPDGRPARRVRDVEDCLTSEDFEYAYEWDGARWRELRWDDRTGLMRRRPIRKGDA